MKRAPRIELQNFWQAFGEIVVRIRSYFSALVPSDTEKSGKWFLLGHCESGRSGASTSVFPCVLLNLRCKEPTVVNLSQTT